MNSNSMLLRVPPWAWGPIGAAIISEAASNGLRAYDLGLHFAQHTVSVGGASISIAGVVLVLGSVAVSCTQTRAAWVALTRGHNRVQRLVAAGIGLVCLATSIAAMASHVIEAQRAKSGDESTDRRRYDAAEAAYKSAKNALDALGTPRAVTVIQAEIRGTITDWKAWRSSNECSDISLDRTALACKPILELYKERGQAATKAELEPRVEQLRKELSALRRPEAAQAAESWVSGWWGWVLGVCVVMIATFGPVVFGGMTPPAVSVAEAPPVPQPATVLVAEPSAPAVLPPPTVETDPPAQVEAARKFDEADSLDDIRRSVTGGERFDVSEYAARWGVNPSESSRRIRDFETRGDITTGSDGRRKIVLSVRPALAIASA